jgi:hypothetical protein
MFGATDKHQETTMAITGGCLCGAVRYTVDAEPMAARQCWCRDCQYLGGGSSTVNVCFPSDAVEITGQLANYDSTADSGTPMRRGFCPSCGTPVTTHALSRPHLMFFRIGTLDDPTLIAPQMTIWTESAPAWALIDPDVPSFPGQVPPVA